MSAQPVQGSEEDREKSAEYAEFPSLAYMEVYAANRRAEQAEERSRNAQRRANEAERRLIEPDDKKKSSRAPEHLVLSLTLLAIGFVGLRILIVSRGDSDTLRALVQNLNVTAIVLATILPVVTIAVFLFFALALMSGLDQFLSRNEPPKPGKKKENWAATLAITIVLIGPLTAAVCWFAMPIRSAIIAVIISVILLFVYFAALRSQRFKDLFQGLAATYILLLVVVFLFGILAQVGVWLPRERLTIGWWNTGIVYVLSSDQEWTKYLDDESHRVKIVPTKDIKRRAAVNDQDDWSNQTPSEVWQQRNRD